eukprot:6201786-Pleurochrysis_carterae.AAC.1
MLPFSGFNGPFIPQRNCTLVQSSLHADRGVPRGRLNYRILQKQLRAAVVVIGHTLLTFLFQPSSSPERVLLLSSSRPPVSTP